MAITARRLTYDDLMAISQERPGDRHELFAGELVVSPSPVSVHQIISANIFRRLDRFTQEQGLGRAFYAPIDVMISPDTVLIPDLLYIAQSRLGIIGGQTVNEPPDIVVEILSPGTRTRDLEAKRAIYARFKVPEYWIVDPQARSVTVLMLIGERYAPVPSGGGEAVRSRVLPGLNVTLDEVFADVP
jgi:Uma2 family endonuclease